MLANNLVPFDLLDPTSNENLRLRHIAEEDATMVCECNRASLLRKKDENTHKETERHGYHSMKTYVS